MADDAPLFLSFNSENREAVRAVQKALAARGIATFFDEQNLHAGRNWPFALEAALKKSRAVAVFIGARVGRWQRPEIGFALDRQASDQKFPVIPVLLDGADTERSLLFLNMWIDLRGDRLGDDALLDVLANAANGAGEAVGAAQLDVNPFRGLAFFDEEHAPFFFGRESFVDDLYTRLTRDHKNFVAVIGASGSGKSSVVRAGLIPKLRRQRPPNETWDVAVFTPGDRPWYRLADALGPLRFPEKSDTDLDIEINKLARALQAGELSLDNVLDGVLKRQGQAHRLLLVIDQLEELFTLTAVAERAAFIDALLKCLAISGVVLVPTLRADFYGLAIESDRRLSDVLGKEQVTLGRMTSAELEAAITKPAARAQLSFDVGLPALLLSDAGAEPGNLPLLQHALLALYGQRQGQQLTHAAYQAIGGIRKAIANSAEREYQQLAAAGEAGNVRSVFTQLVRLSQADEGQEDTRRRVPTAALSAEARTIVDKFAGYRFRLLVKSNERLGNAGEQETVEVAHEALIREWSRLQGWLNEDRGFYLWRQRLDLALSDYTEHSNSPDYLLQGPALVEAEGKLAAPMPEPLNAQQRNFVEASVEARDRAAQQAQEAEAARQHEKETLLTNE
jgi:hypothetical protein